MSILGHVTNRKGGRPPEAQQMGSEHLDNRMSELQDTDGKLFQQLQQGANASSGFAAQTNERINASQGGPGGMYAQNRQLQVGAQEQAQGSYLNTLEGRQGLLNQLTQMKTGVDQYNNQLANQNTMNQWNAGQDRRNDMWTGIGGGLMNLASGYNDNQLFKQQQAQSDQTSEMFKQFLNRFQSGGQ